MTLSEELTWRGFVNQTTYQDIAVLDRQQVCFYFGVDPSADSMQIGNLAAAMMVKTFAKHGHKAFLLVGGATGMIGDPDGKAQERDLLSLKQIADNKKAIASQYKQIFGNHGFELVDNYDWFKNTHYLDFLRDVGKHVPLRQMLARDFVQTRLGEAGSGISYAEFSYVLIQAYDFLHLYKEHGVSLQLCGSDQWGNSIAGVDLIRRKTGGEAHVYSMPLIVNKATGKKFGKTEDGAIWLDPAKTSVFKFYQFWLNADDEGVADYLKVFTELSKTEVDDVMQRFNENKGQRLAQKTLAYEVTTLVHGKDRAEAAKRASEVLFGDANFLDLKRDEVHMLQTELPTAKSVRGEGFAQLLVKAGLASSNSEANRFINSGAVSLNGDKLSAQSQLRRGANLLKRGKNSFAIIERQ